MFYKQEKSRLGESKPRNLNVRIISATNSDIKAEKQKLSEKTYCIVLIPWKSICLLCENEKTILYHGALPSKQLGEKYNQSEVILTKRGRIYGTLPLKGNIRELENKIERASCQMTIRFR
jgi:transcriptional regulator with AAA-type ATPase domain